jgi:hypothetical protein
MKSEIIKRVSFTIFLCAVICALYCLFNFMVRYRFENTLDNLNNGAMIIGKSPFTDHVFDCHPYCPGALELMDLKYFIGYRSGYYIEIASKYFYTYQSCSMMLIICSTCLGLATFIIARKGWDNQANDYLRIAFVVSFFFSSMFGLFVTTLKMDENFKVNADKYNELTKVQIDIHSYLINYSCDDKLKSAIDCDSLNKLSEHIRDRVKEEVDLVAGIDFKAIPDQIVPDDSN